MNIAQEYTIRQFKAGTFVDQNGNSWCDMVLEEKPNEPVRIVVKDPSKFYDGMKLYGSIKEHTSKAGKTYLRFHREQRQEAGGKSGGYDSEGMAWGNSLTNAVQIACQSSKTGDDVHSIARDALEIARLFFENRPGTAVGTTETKQQYIGKTDAELNSLTSTFGKDAVADVPDNVDLNDLDF